MIVALLFFVSLPAHAMTPNDPFFSDQWYLPKIHMFEAWDRTTGSQDVVVAVLDTGMDLDHPDLVGNLWTNPVELLGNGVDDDGNGFVDDVYGWDFIGKDAWPAPDLHGETDEIGIVHGTIIAGIIGAIGNNGEGVAGINWRVRLMPVRILDSLGSGDSDVAARGIRYAVRNGADVINLSFTGFDVDEDFKSAIHEAYDAGIVVVAAVGNKNGGGEDLDVKPIYPACLKGAGGEDWVIGVAASSKRDDKKGFSNFGSACTDLSAPGEDIASASFDDPSRTDLSGPYSSGWGGTSLAAPMVSGAAALLKAVHPTLTPSQILTILQLSVDPLKLSDPSFTGKLGAGRLNIARALELSDPFASPLPSAPSVPLSLPFSAPSPITGLPETVSTIIPGDYIRSPSFSTVYFVTSDGKRRPFLDAQTFLTYTTFDQVKTVTDATLPLLPLALPMLPKPGTVLVKIQSDPQTYWVENAGADGRPILRLIPNESEAIRLFGNAWADFVLDVPVTAWRWYAVGADVGSGEILPIEQLRRREDLR